MAKRKRKLVDVLDVERFEQAKAAIAKAGVPRRSERPQRESGPCLPETS